MVHSPFTTYGPAARVPAAVVQVVHSGVGATVRLPALVAQVVAQNTASYLRVSGDALQVVHGLQPGGRLRVADLVAQVIFSGEGATMRDSFTAMQVVWTTGPIDGRRQRSWTYDFDGHSFYVLDLGGPTLVFDTLSGQWTRFETAGFDGAWNFKNGFHWRDGKKVVGGFDGIGTLLELNPDSFLDEGWRPVDYELRGLVSVTGIDFVRQYSLRLVGLAGAPADPVGPATLSMQFSDDQGQTWGEVYTVTLNQNTRQRIEFRSLGAFTEPGRIFRLFDQGGLRFIAYVEAEIGGEKADLPS